MECGAEVITPEYRRRKRDTKFLKKRAALLRLSDQGQEEEYACLRYKTEAKGLLGLGCPGGIDGSQTIRKRGTRSLS